eukprot:2770024-Rhodomonas_salina.1
MHAWAGTGRERRTRAAKLREQIVSGASASAAPPPPRALPRQRPRIPDTHVSDTNARAPICFLLCC